MLRWVFLILVGAGLVKSFTAEGVVQASHPLEALRFPRSAANRAVSYDAINTTAEENPNQCVCIHSDCECCFYLYVPEIGLNSSGCIDVAYLSEDIGLAIAFTFDGRTLLNTSMSVKHPPPLCLMIPFLKEYGHLCVVFYNVDFSSTHYSACVKIDVALWPFCAIPIKLGCFNINGQNVVDYETSIRLRNRTDLADDSHDEQVWRKSGHHWKYAVCSSSSNYISSYFQVALLNVFLFTFVCSVIKFQG